MKNNTMLYCLIVCIGLGCCKEPQPSANSQTPDVIWKTSFGNGLTSSINPIIYGNLVVYSAYDSSNLKSKLIAYNKETGTKIWEWQNKNASSGFFPPSGYYLKNNAAGVVYRINS